MRKIIQANIKIKDDKGHVNIYTLRDIVASSIVLKTDKKPTPPKEEKKDTKKTSKK